MEGDGWLAGGAGGRAAGRPGHLEGQEDEQQDGQDTKLWLDEGNGWTQAAVRAYTLEMDG